MKIARWRGEVSCEQAVEFRTRDVRASVQVGQEEEKSAQCKERQNEFEQREREDDSRKEVNESAAGNVGLSGECIVPETVSLLPPVQCYHNSQCVKSEMNDTQLISPGRQLNNSTSYNDHLAHRETVEVVPSLKSSTSSVWPSLANAMYHHHHHAMNHHAFQGAGSRVTLSTGSANVTDHQLQQQQQQQSIHPHPQQQQQSVDETMSFKRSSASGPHGDCSGEKSRSKVNKGDVVSAISPSDSGPSNGSLDNNDSNGTVFSGTPEHKGSIASRSEINYPVIGDHSSIYLSKQNRKLVRFVTVIAYIFFVSLAAIVLSFFYYFLWDPSMEGGVASDLPHDHNSASVSLLGTVMERTGRKKFGASHFPGALSPSLQMHPDSRTLPCPCDASGNRLSPSDPSLAPTSDGDSSEGRDVILPPPPAAPTIGHLQQGMHVGVGSKSLSNILPTAPSVYEMIARRPRVIPIHASFSNDVTSQQNQGNHFDSHAQHSMTELLDATDTGDTQTMSSDTTAASATKHML